MVGLGAGGGGGWLVFNIQPTGTVIPRRWGGGGGGRGRRGRGGLAFVVARKLFAKSLCGESGKPHSSDSQGGSWVSQ